MKIDRETFKTSAAFAPMAGVADKSLRELCMSYGASYCIGEMASSKGISMMDKKSEKLLTLTPSERPAGVQIFGDVPDIMAEAAKISLKYEPDFIDINMGCPAPKVAGNGGGSALMKRPLLAGEIVEKCVKAVYPLPITVKIRSGWDDESINAVEVAKICEKAGASLITVHGRTRKQMYAPPVNLNIIKEVKDSVRIPVVGNGDIVDGVSALEMLKITGCDSVMVGRGALGRPWVFKQISEYLKNGTVLPEPPVEERMDIMLRHISALIEDKGEYIGTREARKHSAWYMKGIRGAAAFRRELGTIESFEQLREISKKVIESAKAYDD